MVPKCEVCGQVVKLLLVQNVKMQKQKTETVNRRAKKELENTLKAIKKFETNPCKCKADVQKSIESISKKLKYYTLSEIIYTECTKNKSRGRPKKEQVEEKVTYAVKAATTVSLNDKAIAKEIENELKFAIVTTDTART